MSLLHSFQASTLDLNKFFDKNSWVKIFNNQLKKPSKQSCHLQFIKNQDMTSQEKTFNERIIKEKILPFCKALSEFSLSLINVLLDEARASMSEREFQAHLDQWKTFGKKLNTNDKLLYLKQQNCRILIIELIKQEAMQLFSSSYLNRAKIDQQYIRYLKQLGPYFFIQVIMVVSKLKTIHKHFYKKMAAKITQNHIEIKILRILELCNEKKRSVNNNKAKFLCIVEDQNDRLQITKQLGKMLRESWKRQKSKQIINEIEQQIFQPFLNYECEQFHVQQISNVKQFAKHKSFQSPQNYDFSMEMLNDNMLDFSSLRNFRFRDSDSEEMFFSDKVM